MVISLLFLLLLLAGLGMGLVGFLRPQARWFFLAAGMFWIVSFLGMFSIGWILLAFMFLFLALGVARMLHWDAPWQLAVAAGAGLLVWGIMILWFHEFLWLLWPWVWPGM